MPATPRQNVEDPDYRRARRILDVLEERGRVMFEFERYAREGFARDPDRSRRGLLQALDLRPRGWKNACRHLAYLGTDSGGLVTPALRRLLNSDEDRMVRAHAGEALGNLGDKTSAPKLLDLARELDSQRDSTLLELVAPALLSLKPEGLVDFLVTRLRARPLPESGGGLGALATILGLLDPG